ncbi:MAG: ArsR/SmtB family transcription factor [Chloroflexota bacterium]
MYQERLIHCAMAKEEALGRADGRSLVVAFRALASPVRLRLARMLAQREELCVCELEAALGGRQSLTSYHLRLLEEAGLVSYRECGTWRHYRLERDRLAEILTPQCCVSLIGGDIDGVKREEREDRRNARGAQACSWRKRM